MRWIKSIALFLAATVAVLVLSISPAEAQFAPVWEGNYYDNPYFEDPPAFTRTDANIRFDWGLSSPRGRIPPENFSVRWGTDVNLPAGNYRFYVLADEEVKIALDFGAPIINTFGNAQIGRIVTEDVSLNGGTHHIQVDYREFSGNASIYFSFESLEDGINGPGFAEPTPATPNPESQPIADGIWTATYYPNAALVGTPTLVRQEFTPDNNWGASAPDFSLPIDNWSARWTRNISLAQGTYRITAQADDGIRVLVNNTPVINEWHIATGNTYTSDLSLPTGVHTFVVEFYEGAGGASLNVDILRIGSQGPVVPDTATATVNTGRLNLRSQPNPFSSILATLDSGDTFRALGYNASRTWVQLQVFNLTGWVNASYVTLNNAGGLPIVDGSATQPPPPTVAPVISYNVTATPFPVNIRTGPGTSFEDIGNLPQNAQAQVIGRNANATWWQINYRGIIGWVSAVYARIESGADVSQIPVTE